VIYSEERLPNRGERIEVGVGLGAGAKTWLGAEAEAEAGALELPAENVSTNKTRVNGSMVQVTATFGFYPIGARYSYEYRGTHNLETWINSPLLFPTSVLTGYSLILEFQGKQVQVSHALFTFHPQKHNNMWLYPPNIMVFCGYIPNLLYFYPGKLRAVYRVARIVRIEPTFFVPFALSIRSCRPLPFAFNLRQTRKGSQ